MKRITTAILAISLLFLGMWTISHAQTASDIAGSQYKASIEALLVRNIASGYSDRTFRPYQPINRAEFLKLIMTATGRADSSARNCFPDVSQQWFAPFVCEAVLKELIKGYPDGRFRPEQPINMVEAMKIAEKAFSLSIESAEPGEQWYTPLQKYFHNNNVFSQYSYTPDRPLRREEMAFMLNELILYKEAKRNFNGVRNSKSTGCGIPAPETIPREFTVNEITRTAIVHVPSNYNPNTPLALLFGFHGRTTSNSSFQSYVGLDRASRGKAITVYPAGLSAGTSSYSWTTKDFEFFDVMRKELERSYCINTDEIYVMGHSLGAWMANSIACARGDVIRGVATLAGGRANVACSGPVAAMIWHNPKDNLTPFSQGVAAKNAYRTQNRCTALETPTAPSSANCVTYSGCLNNAPVVWCPHTIDTDRRGNFVPHSWPSGTGQHMWNFFSSL